MDDFSSDTIDTDPTHSLGGTPANKLSIGNLPQAILPAVDSTVIRPHGELSLPAIFIYVHRYDPINIAGLSESVAGLASVSAQLPGRAAGITISETPVFLSSPIPATTIVSTFSTPSGTRVRKRGRPPLTSENSPSIDDSRVLISLGMSPFMPGQDTIYNQNRFVKNEAILSRHLSSLQRSLSQLESNHARLSEEVRHNLNYHKARIDRPSISPAGTESDSQTTEVSDNDFLLLRRKHTELRQAVDAIVRYITLSSSSTHTGLDELMNTVRNLSPTPLGSSILPSHNSGAVKTNLQRNILSGRRLSVSTLEEHVGHKRRARRSPYPTPSERNLLVTRSLDTLSGQQPSIFDRPEAVVDSNGSDIRRRVIYGPVNNADDHRESMAIVEEAIGRAGLGMNALRSVRQATGRLGYLALEFLKEEDASRFLDPTGTELREYSLGRDLSRDIDLGFSELRPSGQAEILSSRSRIRPWQL